MRVRAWTQQNFTGEDETEALDQSMIDQRTRLYYTAKFSDHFKLVNKFEMDMDWGVDADVGVDFVGVEIKNSYVDFDLGDFNFKLGAQGANISRGFLFADDFGGAVITYKGDGFTLPIYWLRFYEGGAGKDMNDQDFDYFAIAPSFKAGDNATIQPVLAYVYSKDASGLDPIFQSQFAPNTGASFNSLTGDELCELGIFFIGVNADFKLDGGSVWFTGLYEGGSVDSESGDNDFDVAAYLLALGGNTSMGGVGLHGQIFYATGQDLEDDTDEINAFWVPSNSNSRGQSYYWAEIMGYGIFDDNASNGSPFDKISNIMAANLGATFQALENTKLTADIWYAQHQEDDYNGNSDLGTEIDLKSTTKLMDNLNLDIVAAMLFAGDATTEESDNDANPWLLGAQLSLSF
jgi:hypothetical protein